MEAVFVSLEVRDSGELGPRVTQRSTTEIQTGYPCRADLPPLGGAVLTDSLHRAYVLEIAQLPGEGA